MKYFVDQFDEKMVSDVEEMIDRYISTKENETCNIYHKELLTYDGDDGSTRTLKTKDKTALWCLNTAFEILSKYYPVKNECRLFEIWKYQLNGERTIESPLTMHTDNDNGDDIHTFILYTRKDPGIHGGNLIIYKNCDGEISAIVRPKAGMIVCMDGDTYHRPEMMSGIGTRSCVVIQFAKDKNVI